MAGDPVVEPSCRATVLQLIEQEGGPNFGHYKDSSLDRRLLARLEAVGCRSVAEYSELLQAEPDERHNLIEALMVGVTSFFRDPEVFEALRTHVSKPLLGANASGEIRIWSAACSTGQEPYSLAILFSEVAEDMGKPLSLRVFATDLSARALAVASAGIYDQEGLEGLDKARRDRWFVPVGGNRWKVRDELRRMVTFARHDVTRDPPFPRMDLVCARNLLIYLNREGQERALGLFHFAMLPGAVLAVGESELTAGHRDLFRPMPAVPGLLRRAVSDGTYQSAGGRSARASAGLDGTLASGLVSPAGPWADRRPSMSDLLDSWLQQRGGSGLFLDNEERVAFAFGDVWQYLPPPRGKLADFALGDLPNEALRVALRHAVSQAGETGMPYRFAVPGADGSPALPGRVDPFRLPSGTVCFLLVLEPESDSQFAPVQLQLETTTQDYLRQLEQRAAALEATLQEERALRIDGEERLRATNEELRAANEEQLSINEELRATTEELREKVAELSRAKQEIERTHEALSSTEAERSAILDHLSEGVLYLTRDRRCQWANPAAARIGGTTPGNLLGRSCFEALYGNDQPCAGCPVEDVLRTGVAQESAETRMPDGRIMRLAATPVQDEHGRLTGVVQHYHDVTDELRMGRELGEREQLFRAIYESSPLGILAFDPLGNLQRANPACLAMFGVADQPSELERLRLFENWHLSQQQIAALGRGEGVRLEFDVDFTEAREGGRYRTSRNGVARLSMAVTPLRSANGGQTMTLGYLAQIEEITRRHEAERQRQRSLRQYREVFENANTILVRTGPTLTIEDLNPAAEQALCVSREEVIGHNYAELFLPSAEERERLIRLASSVLGGHPLQGHLQRVRTPEGDLRTCLWNSVRATDEDGRPIGLILSGVDVSERHELEERRREQNERLLEAERTANVGHWQWQEGQGCTILSGGAKRILGLGEKEGPVEDEDFWGLVHPGDRQEVEMANSLTMTTGNSRELVYRVVLPDDTLRHVRETQQPMHDERGQIIGVRGTILDVTAIRRAEEFWRLALNSVGDGVWERNLRTGATRWSDSWYRMLGYEPGEIPASYESFRELVHTDDRAKAEAAVRECQEGKRDAYQSEFRVQHKDGRWIWMLARGRVIDRDANGEGGQFVGTQMDISARKLMEEKLARRQQDLQEIFEGTSPVTGERLLERMTLHMDRVLGLDYSFVSKLTPGKSHSEATMSVFRSPQGVLPVRSYRLDGSASAHVFSGETVICEDHVTERFPDDTDLVALGIRGYIGVPLRSADGEILGVMGGMSRAPLEDVDFVSRIFLIFAARASAEMEQRAMVDRLRQSEQRLHQIVQNMPVLVMAHGEDDLVQFWNAECERVSGYAQNEIVGNPEAEKLLCPHGYLGGNAKGLDSYRNVECILTTKDGNTRTILWSDLSSGCQVPGWSRWAVGIDITEQRRHEDNFRHAQKMSAVGELAAGVAHDFNNLLHVILGSNDQVLEAPRLDEEARQAARNVRHAARRGSDLVRQLMYFSRRESFHPEPQDLGLLVKHTLPVLRQGTGKGVRIRFVPAEGPCLAKVDAGQLGQALLNLCLNASDAMDCRTGHIEIGVQLRELSGEEAACRNLDSGDYVELRVSDDGSGIPPEAQEQVFEPFFTTKGKAQGSGMGLASTYAIMERHGGTVYFDTVVGEGTTFRLLFPASEDGRGPMVAPVAKPSAGHRTRPLAGRTVLVAEDEPLVLRLAIRALEMAGATVLPARNGREAVEIFGREGEHVDALLLDAIMPEMNGRDAYLAITQIRADVPTLFVSGYSADILSEGVLRGMKVKIIQKPCTPREMVASLSELLENASTGNEPIGEA